jgi:hypothetical protein
MLDFFALTVDRELSLQSFSFVLERWYEDGSGPRADLQTYIVN